MVGQLGRAEIRHLGHKWDRLSSKYVDIILDKVQQLVGQILVAEVRAKDGNQVPDQLLVASHESLWHLGGEALGDCLDGCDDAA